MFQASFGHGNCRESWVGILVSRPTRP